MEMAIKIMGFISIVITTFSVLSFYTPWVWKLKNAEMWIYSPVMTAWSITALTKLFSVMFIE